MTTMTATTADPHKPCENCDGTLVRRPDERRGAFARRRFCGQTCANLYRIHGGPTPRPEPEPPRARPEPEPGPWRALVGPPPKLRRFRRRDWLPPELLVDTTDDELAQALYVWRQARRAWTAVYGWPGGLHARNLVETHAVDLIRRGVL